MLDTSYPKIVERLLTIYASLKERQRQEFHDEWKAYFDRTGTGGAYPGFEFEPPVLYIDATGVGQPVVDMLREAGLKPTAVYLTSGHQENREQGEIHLPKNLLVSNLQVLLQTQRCHLPDTPEAHALREELLNYEIKVTESQNLKMGVFTVGKHDDLATALGLACRPYTDHSAGWGPIPYFLSGEGIRERLSAGWNGRYEE